MRLLNCLSLLIVLAFLPLTMPAQSQEPVCGTEQYMDRLKQQNSELKQIEKRANRLIREQEAPRAKRNEDDKRIIPVVVHVIHDGGTAKVPERAIRRMIERLNTDFQLKNEDTTQVQEVFKDRLADMNYEFRLVKKTPDGSCTNGITYTDDLLTNGSLSLGNLSRYTSIRNSGRIPFWDPESYLNIWTVQRIRNGGRGAIAGMANFPFFERLTDGIMVRADQIAANDRTLTHEVGHYIGLYHPFQDGCNGTGDRVDDTPPAAERNGIIGCGERNTCGGQLPDNLTNYMDYTTCGSMFTKGQKARADRFFSAQFRGELVSDANLSEVGVKVTSKAPKIATIEPGKRNLYTCENVSFRFSAQEGQCEQGTFQYGEPTSVQWEFEGGKPQSSNAFSPEVSYDEPGTYEVSLTATNESGTDKVVKTRFINVLGADAALAPPFIKGFENSELVESGVAPVRKKDAPTWKRTTDAASFGEGALFLNNYNIRSERIAQFRLPRLDLSDMNNPTLKYDLAFATNPGEVSDRLRVYYSTDCGQTWEEAAINFHFNMTTKEQVDEAFYPEDDAEWLTKEVNNLPAKSDLLVRFDWQTSAGGNNAFIDNIRMNWTVGRESAVSANAEPDIGVYPNPTKGTINLQNNGSSLEGPIQVTNATGQVVYEASEVRLPGGADKSFTASELNLNTKGVYYLSIRGSEKTITRKIVLVE